MTTDGHSTFLQHGDAEVLLALRMSAAYRWLHLAVIGAAAVAHRQYLDLTVVLLEGQAIHRCSVTIGAERHGVEQKAQQQQK